MKICSLCVTHASKEDAEKVSNHLLHKKFIPYINFFPVLGMYCWEGTKETDIEVNYSYGLWVVKETQFHE